MEFIYNFILLLSPINFYIKIFFILFLFILNIYLFIIFKKGAGAEAGAEKSDIPAPGHRVLQSGFNVKNLKSVLGNLVSVGGFVSIYITLKNELKDHKIGKLDQVMETERVEIRKSIDKGKEEHQRILNSLESNREELFKLHAEKAKLVGHNDRLLTLHNSIKNNIVSFKDKSTNSDAKLSDLGILFQLIQQDTNKFTSELNYLISQIEKSNQFGAREDLSTSTETGVSVEKGGVGNSNEDSIKESVIAFPFLNLDLSKRTIDWFESLIIIKQLAVCLIISKSVIFSALISIIFIFYGNILIEKYKIESRFPKLATIIRLRLKFQKYYFKFYCGLIITAVITEVVFSIAVLTL